MPWLPCLDLKPAHQSEIQGDGLAPPGLVRFQAASYPCSARLGPAISWPRNGTAPCPGRHQTGVGTDDDVRARADQARLGRVMARPPDGGSPGRVALASGSWTNNGGSMLGYLVRALTPACFRPRLPRGTPGSERRWRGGQIWALPRSGQGRAQGMSLIRSVLAGDGPASMTPACPGPRPQMRRLPRGAEHLHHRLLPA